LDINTIVLSDGTFLEVRPAVESDYPFIAATALKGLYYGCSFWRRMEQETFFSAYKQILFSRCVNPKTRVLIACDLDDKDLIRGYVIKQDNVLHWVHVKQEWRHLGLGRILTAGCDTMSQMSDKAESWSLTFNPFML
jgi:ribosomal protein S18 acetylase RimI-like enzyme